MPPHLSSHFPVLKKEGGVSQKGDSCASDLLKASQVLLNSPLGLTQKANFYCGQRMCQLVTSHRTPWEWHSLSVTSETESPLWLMSNHRGWEMIHQPSTGQVGWPPKCPPTYVSRMKILGFPTSPIGVAVSHCHSVASPRTDPKLSSLVMKRNLFSLPASFLFILKNFAGEQLSNFLVAEPLYTLRNYRGSCWAQ